VLEFVLNVRDVDEPTPILVVDDGNVAGVLKDFLAQRKTFVLAGPVAPEELVAKLTEVLKEKGFENEFRELHRRRDSAG